MYVTTPVVTAKNKSYNKKPLNNICIICTKTVDATTYLPSFLLSLLYSSSYHGLNIKTIATKTNEVNMYVSAPCIPNPMHVPINVKIYITPAGTAFASAAAKIASPNGAIPFIPAYC